jgi:low affinity Fe/Cu permease
MKSTIQFTIAFIFIVSIICNVQLYRGYTKLENKLNERQQTTFIWNDDEESIPTDNSLITLEMTKGDTIYIGSYDKSAKTK